MTLSFDTLRESLLTCSAGFDLKAGEHPDYDGEVFYLIDPYGDQYGDPFESLEDVWSFITEDPTIEEFLNSFKGWTEVHA